MSELDAPCAWTEDDPEACWYCTGEACKRCDTRGNDDFCEHDVIDRHGGSSTT